MPSEVESFLTGIQTTNPKHCISQAQGIEWIRMAYEATLKRRNSGELELLDSRVDKYCVMAPRIEKRWSEVSDFLKPNLVDNQIFRFQESGNLGVAIDERMQFFSDRVVQRAEELFAGEAEPPRHLLHVSCTGYSSPSPLQILCDEKGWVGSQLTHLYHMGCYAALPALRLGRAAVQTEDESMDIYHSELCTLHFSTENLTAEQLIVQSLFADGYARYRILKTRPESTHFRILSLHEKRVPQSLGDMTWKLDTHNFQMQISKDVPLKLAGQIHEGLEELLGKAGITDMTSALENSYFAIHPGGPRILEQIQMLLGLQDWQVQHSSDVLRERGNMSSATLPHIWESILAENKPKGTRVVSLAFGPGLTLFGTVLEVGE